MEINTKIYIVTVIDGKASKENATFKAYSEFSGFSGIPSIIIEKSWNTYDELSQLDFNLIPNCYNQHKIFTEEAEAFTYMELFNEL